MPTFVSHHVVLEDGAN